MKNTQKEFKVLFATLLLILVISGGIYLYTDRVNKIKSIDVLNVSVPSKINQSRSSDTVLQLTHSIPYRHKDLCDMRDGSHINEDFIDYSNYIEIYDGDLTRVFEQAYPHSLSSDFVDSSGKIKIQEGYVDKLTINSKDIYKITTGAEGCGYYMYIIPYGNKAVIIKKDFTPPFSGNFTEETVNEFKNLNGVIKPEEANTIFNSILNQIIENL